MSLPIRSSVHPFFPHTPSPPMNQNATAVDTNRTLWHNYHPRDSPLNSPSAHSSGTANALLQRLGPGALLAASPSHVPPQAGLQHDPHRMTQTVPLTPSQLLNTLNNTGRQGPIVTAQDVFIHGIQTLQGGSSGTSGPTSIMTTRDENLEVNMTLSS